MHNYGYILERKREVSIAMYDAKLIFHLQLPDWRIKFDGLSHNCRANMNTSLICVQLRDILYAARDIKSHSQLHVQHQMRRIHEMLLDVPIAGTGDRSRRGFLTDVLSRVTGLASKDDLDAVENVLEQVETGIYQAAKLWGSGAKSLAASFKLEQNRIQNVFDILGEYRTTIRQIQQDFITSRCRLRFWTVVLMTKVTRFLNNNTIEIAQVDTLYNAIQSLVFGHIPNFILPHDTLTDALEQIQSHLDENQGHMVLSRNDHAYYYLEASFKTFRRGNTLFLVINAPVTLRTLSMPFQLYDLISFPLATPQTEDFYSILATEITSLAFSADADLIVQINDRHTVPASSVWYSADSALVFIDRQLPTCALAIVTGNLADLKTYCRYTVHKTPYPRSVVRLTGNTFLLTNITALRLRCLTNGTVNDTSILLSHVQTVHTFDCHCESINADEFRIVADLRYCENSSETTTVVDMQFPSNLAYLSEYFEIQDLFNLTAQSLLNHSVEIQLPNLAVADKFLDEKFAEEKTASYDMELVINSTKNSGLIYDNLAHYLFNQLIKAHDSQNDFDLLSPWTWLTFSGWVLSAVAFVLAILLRIKLRSLTVLLLASNFHSAAGASIPKIISLTTTAPVTESSVDILAEWIRHVDHVSNVLPIEVLIPLCFIFWILFVMGHKLYLSRRRETVKTQLILEIGNEQGNVLLPIMNLPHTARYYRLIINRPEINFTLMKSKFFASLCWDKGISISDTALNLVLPFPGRIPVQYWQVRKLSKLLRSQHYALIQIVTGFELSDMEVVVLFTLPDGKKQQQQFYPVFK